MNGKIFTLRNLYQSGTEKLEKAGIREAKLDAWYLLEYKTGISRAVFLADPDREVEEEKAESYQKDICTRARRIPLQHITGEQEFMGLNFKVNENVLVPRQDTEILVEEAMRYLSDGTRILDICTGSGCILLSLLKYSNECEGMGVDISEDALAVARENAGRLGIQADFRQSDLLEKVEGRFDMIVSNPPYIETDVIETLMPEVREHEPIIALDGKADGLYFYRKIIEQCPAYMTRGARLFFEIGYDQGEAVKELMIQRGFIEVEVIQDYAKQDRVVTGCWNMV